MPGLRIDPARMPARLKLPPAATVPSPQSGSQQRPVRLRWLPLAIIGGVFLAVGGNALESFRHGDFVGALVPLVFVGFIAFGVVRNLLRKRS